MKRKLRSLSVTVGLIVGGAAFGAVTAVLALAIAMAITGQLGNLSTVGLLGFVTAVGAVLGMAFYPAAVWMLMRRVPVWIALLGTGAATVAGGVTGWMIPARDPFQAILIGATSEASAVLDATAGAVIGFLVAAVLLRITATRDARRQPRVSVA
ncbi:hypothetical protein [Longimicrobium sp.]|uniref:hypothetical protein n=1 Tax=Longimicrobium sp. TaxID=2029185 RepID=UPI002CF03570|nr:hypothetical protein [Longimicrobium sp.]HSU16101.1 hypothetical protein [Longimicrobium sp.]